MLHSCQCLARVPARDKIETDDSLQDRIETVNETWTAIR